MKSKPVIVTLCGSTRFKEQFIFANFKETRAGRIVLSVGFFNHADKHFPIDGQEKIDADELHKRKIDISDEILVIDVLQVVCPSCKRLWRCDWIKVTKCGCGEDIRNVKPIPYIGSSTRSEIDYAIEHGKKVRYWSQEEWNKKFK